MLDLQATPAESASYVVFKRVFDVIFSAVVIFVTAPLMALIALAIRVGSFRADSICAGPSGTQRQNLSHVFSFGP